jgi:light-regulated signal transduction histidine kinase (bacteriophytochrome)
MKKMSGVGIRPFDGSFKSFEKHIHDEDVQHFSEALRRTLEENKPFETIFRVRQKQGVTKYLIVKGMLYNDDGGLSRIVGVGIDITEMKKGSEHALFKLNEELARSNKELEQFAYVASHDLQEPLRMVSIFTQMLAQRYGDTLDENAREYIKFAVDGSKRMYNLINGLLAYSRIQTKGKEFTEVDINNVLEEILRNLSLQIEKVNAVISLSDMPVIYADKSQMIQLFQNLISNSIKFSKGIPKIKVSSIEHDDYYLFSVKDEGIGIDPQYFERIFQIFQRLLPREEYEGTGIGLSICKRIVERHGGKIWVKSKPEKGSTFWFTIKKEL